MICENGTFVRCLLAVSSKRIEKREMSLPVPHNSTRPFTGDTLHRITEEVNGFCTR